MSNLKWKPREDKIALAGKGLISADTFSQSDLDALIARAKNRNINVETFLMNAGLVKVDPQIELDLQEANIGDAISLEEVRSRIKELPEPEEAPKDATPEQEPNLQKPETGAPEDAPEDATPEQVAEFEAEEQLEPVEEEPKKEEKQRKRSKKE